MFACFTVSLLQNCSSVHLASNILKLDWDAVDLIMKRGVERGLLRRKPDNVLHVGMDGAPLYETVSDYRTGPLQVLFELVGPAC